MTIEPVRSWIEGRVAHVQIDRPTVGNSLDPETIRALGRALARIDASTDTSVIVLESAGEGAFCAGADLRTLAGLTARESLPGTTLYTDLLRGFRHLGPIVVGRVQGPAMGGGLGLALSCDLVIASNRARFGTPEASVGLFPMMVLAPLTRHLPPKILARLVFAGQPLGASEAERWGIVNAAVEPDDLDDAIDDLIEAVLRGNRQALRQGRRALHAMQDLTQDAASEYLRTQLELLWRTGQAEEGVLAFLEKREPAWRASE